MSTLNDPQNATPPGVLTDAMGTRRSELFDYVMYVSNCPLQTTWGSSSHFDGYYLAFLETGSAPERAYALLSEALDRLQFDSVYPRVGWNLSDFALCQLFRAYFLFRDKYPQWEDLWSRFEWLCCRYPFRTDRGTENHKFLHRVCRYLTACAFPDRRLFDDVVASEARDAAKEDIRDWIEEWVRNGSAEFHSDIYYLISALGLYNLVDFAPDEEIAKLAKGVLDLICFELAINTFDGHIASATLRSYGVFRVEMNDSPARSWNYLLYSSGASGARFNQLWCGPALAQATSRYRPPAPCERLAGRQKETHVYSTTHARRTGEPDRVTICRGPHAMLTTHIHPGGDRGHDEQTVQATFDGGANAFLIQSVEKGGRWHGAEWPWEPCSTWPIHPDRTHRKETPDGGVQLPWVEGHVPPGLKGDSRPGLWHGNGSRPMAIQVGNLSALLYRGNNDTIDWPGVRLFLPRWKFDLVEGEKELVFARKNDGYLAVWSPAGWTETVEGDWAHCEWRSEGWPNAAVMVVGDATAASFEAFKKDQLARQPRFEAGKASLRVTLDGGRVLELADPWPPTIDGEPVEFNDLRFDTPWCRRALGETDLEIAVEGLKHRLEFSLKK